MIGFHWGTGAVVADLRRQLNDANAHISEMEKLVNDLRALYRNAGNQTPNVRAFIGGKLKALWPAEAALEIERLNEMVQMAGREIARMQEQRDEARAERRRIERLWLAEVEAHKKAPDQPQEEKALFESGVTLESAGKRLQVALGHVADAAGWVDATHPTIFIIAPETYAAIQRAVADMHATNPEHTEFRMSVLLAGADAHLTIKILPKEHA